MIPFPRVKITLTSGWDEQPPESINASLRGQIPLFFYLMAKPQFFPSPLFPVCFLLRVFTLCIYIATYTPALLSEGFLQTTSPWMVSS